MADCLIICDLEDEHARRCYGGNYGPVAKVRLLEYGILHGRGRIVFRVSYSRPKGVLIGLYGRFLSICTSLAQVLMSHIFSDELMLL